jgi:hypothetical protein
MALGPSLAAVLLGISGLCFPVMAQDIVDVPVGYSEIFEASELPATVVVGRPEIADVTIANRTVILTAKEEGRTNVILLDEEGDELFRTTVQVVPLDRRPKRDVRVIEGGSDEDGTRYLCGPQPGCIAVTENERNNGTIAEVNQEAPAAQTPELPPSVAPSPGEPGIQ